MNGNTKVAGRWSSDWLTEEQPQSLGTRTEVGSAFPSAAGLRSPGSGNNWISGLPFLKVSLASSDSLALHG